MADYDPFGLTIEVSSREINITALRLSKYTKIETRLTITFKPKKLQSYKRNSSDRDQKIDKEVYKILGVIHR